MKIFKLFSRFTSVFLLVMMLGASSVSAAILDTDTFAADLESWSGTGVSVVSGKMKVGNQSTATKTFSYPAYANQGVTLTLTIDNVAYDAGETTIITINGRQDYNSSSEGALTFNGWLDSSGNMTVTIKSNSNSSSEYVNVDDVALNTGYTYTIDNERDFTQQYTKNTIGDIALIGNTVLCKSSVQTASYKTGTCVAPASGDSNDDIYTLYSKLAADTDASIFNSSSSDLTIPTGSTVLWATLYWQGGLNSDSIDTTTGDATLTNMTAAMDKAKTVLFKSPDTNGAYIAITSSASKFNWNNNAANYNYYQGAVDVTQYVKQSGTYQLANLVANDGNSNGGTGPYGGWSLMVVYEDLTSGTSKLKNMIVYDGYKLVNTNITKTLSGFLTPLSGVVDSKFTMFAAEADSTRTDTISMTNSAGTFVTVASDELASSIVGADGLAVTTRTPSYGNTIGTDIHTWDVGTTVGAKNIIDNNQTTTDVKFTYGTDIYNLGLFAFSTNLYEPDVCYIENIFKGTTNISGIGAQVNEDDNLTVRVYIKNKGTEAASGVSVLHQFDSSFPYAANSANYNNSNPAYEIVMPPLYTRTTATDSAGNDLYEYNSTSLVAKINLGTGATSSSGGTFDPSTTTAVFEYSATVKILDSNYSNVYKAGYINSVLGIDYTSNPVTIYSCDGSVNSFYGYAPPAGVTSADIIDTFTSTTNYNNGTDKVIQTKVVSKDNVTITAVHLDDSGLATAYAPSDPNWNYSVIPYWSDETCSSQENVLNMSGEQVVIDIPNNQASATALIQIKDKAVKNARFKIIVVDPATLSVDGQQCIENSSTSGNFARIAQCANSEVQYKTAFGDNAWNRCGLGGGKPCESSNHGSANPSEPTYNPLYSGELGCYICTFDLNPSCSTDNFAIRPDTYTTTITGSSPLVAGENFTLTTVAKGFNTTALTGYDGDANITALIADSTKTCDVPDGNLTIGGVSPAVIHFNGVDTNVSNNVKFGDVGVFDVNITDSTWTAVDSVKSECIANSDTNVTDANGKVGCLARGVYVQKVIPHHFDVSGTLENGSTGFTYLNNFGNDASLDQNISAASKISALLTVNVTAERETNTTTQNYSSQCYAQDGNSTITFVLTPTPNDLTQLIWYDDINNAAFGSSNIDTNMTTFSHPAERFTSGVGNLNYRLNFDRNQTMVVNPFTMTVNEVNATDSDSVDGNQTLTSNNSAYYVYGRIIPRDVRVFGANTPFTANAWYEVYNASMIGTVALPISKNDANWHTNTLHTDLSDGDGDVTRMQTNGAAAATLPLFDINTFTAGVETYTETAGWALNGYKAHVDTAPWLWYGINALNYVDPATGDTEGACLTHPCFNINVVPAVGATGSAKSTNEATKASKKSDSSGWRSTTDYAPAVR